MPVKLIKEVSLVKIRSLNPKIDEEFMPIDFNKKRVETPKELKKKVKL